MGVTGGIAIQEISFFPNLISRKWSRSLLFGGNNLFHQVLKQKACQSKITFHQVKTVFTASAESLSLQEKV